MLASEKHSISALLSVQSSSLIVFCVFLSKEVFISDTVYKLYVSVLLVSVLDGYFLCSSWRVVEKCKNQHSLQTESAGLLHCRQHLLVQHGERGVRGEVQTIETCVSSTTTNKDRKLHFLIIYISKQILSHCIMNCRIPPSWGSHKQWHLWGKTVYLGQMCHYWTSFNMNCDFFGG